MSRTGIEKLIDAAEQALRWFENRGKGTNGQYDDILAMRALVDALDAVKKEREGTVNVDAPPNTIAYSGTELDALAIDRAFLGRQQLRESRR